MTDLWEVFIDSYDCETCGFNSEEAQVERGGDLWQAYVKVGCYGGGSVVDVTRDEVLEFLADWKHVVGQNFIDRVASKEPDSIVVDDDT